MDADMQERISARAYRIWEEKGRPHGSSDDHWHQAKREIEEEDRAAGRKPSTAAKAPRTRKTASAASSASASTSAAAAPAKPRTARKSAPRDKPPAGKKG